MLFLTDAIHKTDKNSRHQQAPKLPGSLQKWISCCHNLNQPFCNIKMSYWMPSTKVEICAVMILNSPHRLQTTQILFRMIPPLSTQQHEPSAFQFTSCLAFFYNRNRYFWFSKCDSSVLLQSSSSKCVCVSCYLPLTQPPSLTHTTLSSCCCNNLSNGINSPTPVFFPDSSLTPQLLCGSFKVIKSEICLIQCLTSMWWVLSHWSFDRA